MISRPASADRLGPSAIQVGAAIYSLSTAELIGEDEQQVVLRQQSAQVLQILAQNFGRLVTRDNLFAEVWAGVSVTDDSLTQCIAEIRRAINDTDKVILKTVPKRGYMLHGQALDMDVGLQATENARARSSSEHQNVIVPLPISDERELFPTLAVLPFQAKEEASGGVFGAFLADEVIHAISRSKDLNVVSRLSTFGLSIEDYGPGQLGTVLNADYILSGAVVRAGNTTHLWAEFSETEKGFVLFTEKLDFQTNDTANSSLGVSHLIQNIRKHISTNEIRKVRANPLENLEHYSILTGSVALMHRLSPGDFRQSRIQLEHLISQAPNHPVPKAWMARWHVMRAVQGWSEDIRQEAQNALVWTEKALDIDPENALALVCEGHALTHLSRDLEGAKERYDEALMLNPNDANGVALRGMLASFQDDRAHGVKLAERALHLTPMDPMRFFYLALASGAHVSAQNYERAVELAQSSLSKNSSHVSTWRTLTAAYQGAGQYDLASKTAKKVMALQPDLTIGKWLENSPSAGYENGKIVAELLRAAGIPG